MLSVIIAVTIVNSILIGQIIRRLTTRIKDLESSLSEVRDHVGLTTDDKLDSAVKLIKANRIEEAVQLLKTPNKIVGI